MTDHCFISYSNADALQFARKLADELEGGEDKFTDVWFDKRNIDPARDWDDQIVEGIKSCKCMAFVMTKDSTAHGSMCKNEWTWALKYKKIIIPIRLHGDAEQPFGLGSRQWIDFTGEFEHGLAKLRKFLRDMDSPKGVLQALQDRLADAERALRRAKGDEENRVKGEIEELKAEIKRQEEIVRNPKAAEEKTEKNIQSGLERERKPVKEVISNQLTKFINPPPGVAPTYYQDRLIEEKEIVKFLNNDAQRLLTIVGRAGIGKTAMVCRLLKGLERGELPDDLGELKADGIVYLSETGSHRVNFASIFADLSKLLPPSEETAERLEGIYKNPQTSTGDKMRALLDAFPSGRVILLLDNFETLIDPESLSLRDSELSEALNALLGGQHHAVKAVITTRIAPRDLAISEPGRQHHLSLDEGLESPYAENVLREMDADGRVGLKTAPDALLNKAREKTRGYPRALEALYAILSVDRYTTLEELLELSLPDEVVQKLVGEAFNRLDPSAQKVMQALAVYNRPVSPAAIDYLLQPHLPSIDSALVLNRLVNMHFARREAGRYYLHPADREYAFNIIPVEKDLTTKDTKVTKEDQEDLTAKNAKPAKEDLNLLLESLRSSRASRLTNAFTQHDLLNRAADYFAQARKPRAEWKKLDDLAAQLAEFELRCEAGDYDTATTVLKEIDFNYLILWGHYRLVIDLHLRVKDKIKDKYLIMGNMTGLGNTHFLISQARNAIVYYETGLLTAQETKNRQAEGVFLVGLGNAYNALGDARKAAEFQEQALIITREIRDRTSEGAALGNLGIAYAKLGNITKAIEYYEKQLSIAQEIDNQQQQGNALGSLGNRYVDLDNNLKAIEFYEQSLSIHRKIGDRSGESLDLENIGHALLGLEEYLKAKVDYQQAFQVADEISFPPVQLGASYGLAQACFSQNDLVNARTTIEAALQYDVPEFNHNATALHGIIALRQGERETAQEAFTKSIAQADEILAKTPDYYSALDAKGLALCGLALCEVGVDGGPLRETEDGVKAAMETFRRAREIAPHAGIVKSVLRLFDELAKCDTEGILKSVRNAVEGKAE
jgi:tetratricopeptide (TPR) repeat protein